MEVLFPVFLEDEAEYEQAVAFWQALFADLLTGTDLHHYPYLNKTTVTGITLRNGNPIFDAYFPELKKAVRIIQEEPDGEVELEIGAWLQSTEMDGETETAQELVISLVLSDEALPIAKRLLRKWLLENLDSKSMQQFIDMQL